MVNKSTHSSLSLKAPAVSSAESARPSESKTSWGKVANWYDNLLEMFDVEPVPTVGFGMGDITLRDFLETHKLPLTK